MAFADRLREVRTGFERPFWVANTTEIFERLSYYAVFAALARYLRDGLGFPQSTVTTLGGLFGGGVWILAIFGGALADRIGFRRALSLAYFILTCAYFLVGSIGASWLAPVRSAMPLGLLTGIVLLLPALGVALVKPSVVGTTARASKENVRSIGYSIYYTMVNIGSTLGPLLAGWLHKSSGSGPMSADERAHVENIFRLAAASVLVMFFIVLIFFKEPRRSGEQQTVTMAQVARNFGRVIANWRFVLFLVIFSGYWIVFWQQYLVLPNYIHDHISTTANTEWILATDPIIVIAFTVAISAAMRKVASFRAVVLGSLITSLAWLIVSAQASVMAAVLSLAVLATGEIMQSPRYYEYISRLAPPGQQGTYMGFAFLPIGIGSIVGGLFTGKLYHHFEVAGQPQRFWWVVTAIGVFTTALLWIYDRALKPAEQ